MANSNQSDRVVALLVAALAVAVACSSLVGVTQAALSRKDGVPAVTDWSSIEKLEHALKVATLLPLSSQKLILKKIGEALVAVEGEGPHCNVFGGLDACLPIPESSDYARLCDAHNQKVDCAFEMEALQGIHQDPDTTMRDRLTNDNGNPPCPKCYTALHKFWCAQTVPACGTFDKVVDEILPMISAVALKKATPVAALQEAIPRMVQTASLGLPCREMCDAITDTCGCGEAATFGEVMTSIQEQTSEGFSTNMSSSTAKEVFQNIWNVPVCELFSEETVPGFTGVCDVSIVEPNCEWCSRKNHPTNIHEQIVAQIAQTVSGIMQGGLQTILSEAGGSKHKVAVGQWSWGLDEPKPEKPKKSHTGITVVVVFLLAAALVAFVVAARIHHNRQNPSQYVDLNSMGYTPPIL
ncbi:unnamed protein product [Calypogeia fissa]